MTKPLVPPDIKVGELVFSDICGKLPIIGYNNALYIITFIDAVSKHLFVNAIEDKTAGTVLVVFKKYCNWIANHFHVSVKRLHTDNGGEYVNDFMKEYVDSKGIEHTSTAPYQPQSNGIAERVNRTLMGKVRAMLQKLNIGFEYWPEALLHAVYLHNRTPSSRSGTVTPFEALYERVSSLSYIRIFGCLVYAKVPDEKRQKLFEKLIRTALLRCLPGLQYKVLDLDNSDIHHVRHTQFDETVFPHFGSNQGNFLTQEEFETLEPASDTDSGEEYAHDGDSESNDDSDDDVELDEWIISRTRCNLNTVARTSQQTQEHPTHETDDPNVVTDNSADQGQASDDDDPGGSPNGDSDLLSPGGPSKLSVSGGSSIASSRPHRIRHKPARYTPTHMANAKKELPKKVNTFDTPTLREGMSRDDSHLWRNAVQTEIETLKARETWELAPRPPRTHVLPSQMVLRIKRQPNGDVDRYKARLVALGCLQREEDYDETFSPVVDFTTVRIALALAVREKMHVHHVDVTGAFLYGDLEEEL
jgi:hypothetical protein